MRSRGPPVTIGDVQATRIDRSLRSAAVTAVTVALVVVASLVAFPARAAAATTEVRGTLTVAGAPHQGAQVDLWRWSGSEWLRGVSTDEGWTDAGGEFVFSDLPPGSSYTLTVHGHFPDGTTQAPPGPGAPGTFYIGPTSHAVQNLALPAPARTVTGRVLTLEGEPAGGAFVELADRNEPNDPFYLFSGAAEPDGTFSLPLYDDTRAYVVRAWSDGYLTTYLGDTEQYWEARSFTFADPTGLGDLVLQSQGLGGRVLRAPGVGVPGTTVRLMRWSHADEEWLEVSTRVSGAEGRYVFRSTGDGAFAVTTVEPRGTVWATTGFGLPEQPFPGDFGNGTGFRRMSSSSRVTDFDLALPPAAPGAVDVTGTRAVGGLLRAVPGAWTPGWSLTYQWLRNGSPIAGATGVNYRTTAADGRRRIAVRVTAATAFPGLPDRTVTSPATTVKARSALSLAVDPGRRSAALTIRLALPGTGIAATRGRVVVYVDGLRRAAPLVRAGVARVTLRVPRGRHTFRVRYAGTALYTAASVSRTVRVR